jgi:hypothetical protein
MPSNNGKHGLFAGADIFQPNKKHGETHIKMGETEGAVVLKPGFISKPATARFVPTSVKKSVTANSASGARNMGKGRNGTPKKV